MLYVYAIALLFLTEATGAEESCPTEDPANRLFDEMSVTGSGSCGQTGESRGPETVVFVGHDSFVHLKQKPTADVVHRLENLDWMYTAIERHGVLLDAQERYWNAFSSYATGTAVDPNKKRDEAREAELALVRSNAEKVAKLYALKDQYSSLQSEYGSRGGWYSKEVDQDTYSGWLFKISNSIQRLDDEIRLYENQTPIIKEASLFDSEGIAGWSKKVYEDYSTEITARLGETKLPGAFTTLDAAAAEIEEIPPSMSPNADFRKLSAVSFRRARDTTIDRRDGKFGRMQADLDRLSNIATHQGADSGIRLFVEKYAAEIEELMAYSDPSEVEGQEYYQYAGCRWKQLVSEHRADEQNETLIATAAMVVLPPLGIAIGGTVGVGLGTAGLILGYAVDGSALMKTSQECESLKVAMYSTIVVDAVDDAYEKYRACQVRLSQEGLLAFFGAVTSADDLVKLARYPEALALMDRSLGMAPLVEEGVEKVIYLSRRDGLHGGSRVLTYFDDEVERVYRVGDAMVLVESAATAYRALGKRVAKYLGIEKVGQKVWTLPDRTELNNAYTEFRKYLRKNGLSDYFDNGVTYYDPPAGATDEYIMRQWIEHRKWPYSEKGVHFSHDGGLHSAFGLMPKRVTDHVSDQLDAVTGFVDYVRNLYGGDLPDDEFTKLIQEAGVYLDVYAGFANRQADSYLFKDYDDFINLSPREFLENAVKKWYEHDDTRDEMLELIGDYAFSRQRQGRLLSATPQDVTQDSLMRGIQSSKNLFKSFLDSIGFN